MTARGRKAYFGAAVLSQAVALLRYVLLARMLGPVELGFAAMMLLTTQFFESISDTGSDRFLIQDPDGDAPSMQGLVHLVMAARGLLIAAALAVFAVPLAGVYHSPTLVTSLVALGVAPLIAGLVHLDVRRLQRHGNFWPESLMTMVSETAGLLGTVGAAWFTRDHTAVIYGQAAKAAAMVIISHVMAQRPYRWATGREEGARFSRFAAPLFVNGMLLFAGSQGDRLIVANRVGPAALGQYSAVLLLVFYPSSALSRFIAGMHLPLIAGARSDPQRLDKAAQRLAGQALMLAVAMAAGFTLVGPIATPLLYGKRFAQGATIFAMLGCVQSARFLRQWPTTVAVAVGRSTIVMANNLARMLAFPAALLATFYFRSLEAIISGFLLGEIVAILVALWLLARASTVRLGPELRRICDFMLVSAGLISAAWTVQNHHWAWASLSIAATASVLGLATWNEREVVGAGWRAGLREISRYATRIRSVSPSR
jgi:O-antigen/teichoic acid export membrane protein